MHFIVTFRSSFILQYLSGDIERTTGLDKKRIHNCLIKYLVICRKTGRERAVKRLLSSFIPFLKGKLISDILTSPPCCTYIAVTIVHRIQCVL